MITIIDPFSFAQFFIPLIFIIVIGGIIFNVAKGVSEWHSNNQQPTLTVNTRVVSKRTETSRHMHNHNGHHHHHTTTHYYITFEVESSDRIELSVKGKQYGLIAEGDIGKLTFQGTRYHNFERISNTQN
ncbi:DUF2500 domain-containing protein [Anaerobacillus alkalilacustris]|uniref:DUF2500 domain-containing protein n=1 Tax=Anaerobacillus alkalilacustris TaxID=393763 RepID=UPI000ADC4B01|nr:DUF2500 domain-containing protein [Anaerobacillus alkalilacustris]